MVQDDFPFDGEEPEAGVGEQEPLKPRRSRRPPPQDEEPAVPAMDGELLVVLRNQTADGRRWVIARDPADDPNAYLVGERDILYAGIGPRVRHSVLKGAQQGSDLAFLRKFIHANKVDTVRRLFYEEGLFTNDAVANPANYSRLVNAINKANQALARSIQGAVS